MSGARLHQAQPRRSPSHTAFSLLIEATSRALRISLEATTNCWEVVKILRLLVGRVVVSNPMLTKAIAYAKVKTDKVDARTLAELLRCDYLPTVWQPDDQTRSLRTLTRRRTSLVHQRTMIKNRIHAVLHQRLIDVPFQDLFGQAALAWRRSGLQQALAEHELVFAFGPWFEGASLRGSAEQVAPSALGIAPQHQRRSRLVAMKD